MERVTALPKVNKDQEFLDEAFINSLPFALEAEGWQSGGKPINTISQRVQLAWNIADEALLKRRIAPPPTDESRG